MVGIARLSREELEGRVEALRDIAEPLRAVAETDGWLILQKTFAKQKADYYEKLTRSLMKKGVEINQRELDYNQGFFDSVEQLLEAPENAEKILRKAADRLKREVEKE